MAAGEKDKRAGEVVMKISVGYKTGVALKRILGLLMMLIAFAETISIFALIPYVNQSCVDQYILNHAWYWRFAAPFWCLFTIIVAIYFFIAGLHKSEIYKLDGILKKHI